MNEKEKTLLTPEEQERRHQVAEQQRCKARAERARKKKKSGKNKTDHRHCVCYVADRGGCFYNYPIRFARCGQRRAAAENVAVRGADVFFLYDANADNGTGTDT